MVSSKGQKTGNNKKVVAWTVTEDGALVTSSLTLIKQSLATLKEHRELVNITHKGYLSPKTVLVGYDDEKLQLDKPRDWPGSYEVVDILFKAGQLFHNFTVKIIAVTADSLYTTFPTKLVQLQRRADFRVAAPSGSQATFLHQDKRHEGFAIIDISASGALIASAEKEAISPGDTIHKMALSFAEEGTLPPKYISVPEAKVMRVFRNDERQHCYGVHFKLGLRDEGNLLKYVRQLELAQVRKGML